MPNWCDTTYKAVGSKEAVKKFYDLAISSWNKSQDDNKGWLGYFVTELGGDWQKVRCRGWMRDEPNIDTNGEWCELFAETAWCEPPEWRHFLESKISDLKILYLAIETGLDVFATNDIAYDGKYYVDAYPNFPDNPIMTEEEVCAYIKKNYQVEVNNIEECNAVANGLNDKNEDGDEFIYINAIKLYDD
jgi:hypothetical protein